MEMVEEDIVDRKTRKRVQDPADQGVVRPYETAKQRIGGRRGAGEFEDEERAHQIRDGRAGERKGQPEKGAAEQIKGIGPDEVGAEVGRPAPENVARTHAVVSHLVKRDLLDVEVPVIDEIPLVIDEEGEKQERRGRQGQQEGE